MKPQNMKPDNTPPNNPTSGNMETDRIKPYRWAALSPEARREALARPAALHDPEMTTQVKAIMADVKTRGDAALFDYAQRFDRAELDHLMVEPSLWKSAWEALYQTDKDALITAKTNIEAFHTAQMPKTIAVETMPGVTCRREPRALDTVGLYVPGGTAPLVSTLMMLAIPAKIAGVERRIVITPPAENGTVNPYILASAYLCEVSAVYMSGGAQAIAALTYGTESLPRCDKIFGPGNAYVALAKSLATSEPGGPAIDMPAGPSEAMVIADKDANPAFVASDLLSQAEHDVLAQVICVTTSETMASAIQTEIERQLTTLPRRDIAASALEQSRYFITENDTDILSIINQYAPEHLIIQTQTPERFVDQIQNAGSIFLGPWTPESVGDYASGTNHTLPTYGAARAYSGVNLESFFKYISVQSLTASGLERLGPTVERLAEMEGLEAHKRAVSLRLGVLNPNPRTSP